jgi:tetratricopeptide (TPR) repeat protein
MKQDNIIVTILIVIGLGLMGAYFFFQFGSDPEIPDIPDLDRPVEIREGIVSPDVAEETKERIAELSSQLEEDPDFFSGWIELGSLRKLIEDYEGAKEAWEYVTVIRPKSTIAFLNLGNLYAYHLEDSKKAEEYFLVAIDNNVERILLPYISLHEIYRDIDGDSKKAKDILIRATEDLPETKEQLQPVIDSL